MSKLLVCIYLMLSAVMQAAPDARSSRQLYEQAAKAIASDDSRAAIKPLEQLIEDQPTSPLACIAVVHLAECYVATENQQKAAELLEEWSKRIAIAAKTTKLDDDLDAHHLRVWLLAAKRISDDSASIQSLEALTKSLESRNDSKDQSTEQATAVRELLVDARVELARRLTAVGKLELAAEQLSQLASAVTDSSSDSQLLVAMIHQQLGDHSSAKKILQSIIEAEPKTTSDSLARLELTTYALQERKLDDAAKTLAPLIDADAPHHGLDENAECRFRILWSELELAQGHSKRSLEVLPSDEELSKLTESQQIAVRFSRAEAASQAGQNATALGDLQWLNNLAEKATETPTWAVTVALRRCELLLKTKDYAKLAELAEDSKKRYVRFERLHEFDYLLARSAMSQIDFDQARVHLRMITEAKAAKNTSAAVRAQWMLGETYFLEQNFKEAIDAYKPVTQLADSQPWQSLALMQTAKCYELMNQFKDAMDTYANVVTLTKDEKIRQEATARIEILKRTASRAKSPLR